MMLSSPPQFGQRCMSMSKTRLRGCAQLVADLLQSGPPQAPSPGRTRARRPSTSTSLCPLSTCTFNDSFGAGRSKSRVTAPSLLEPVNLLGSRPSKSNVGYGESCKPGLQRKESPTNARNAAVQSVDLGCRSTLSRRRAAAVRNCYRSRRALRLTPREAQSNAMRWQARLPVNLAAVHLPPRISAASGCSTTISKPDDRY